MTCGLCFHFFGYECARAASITMLAAKVYLLHIIVEILYYICDFDIYRKWVLEMKLFL
jgi:hypothetical protein